ECYRMITHSIVDTSGKVYLVTDKGTYSVSLSSTLEAERLGNLRQQSMQFLTNIRSTPLKTTDTTVLTGTSPRLTISEINYHGAGTPQLFYKLENDGWTESVSGEISSDKLKPNHFYKLMYYAQDDFRSSAQKTLYIFK